MASYVADFYIDSKTLDWATTEGCPSIFNEYVADILVDALGINGDANVFCKCRCGGYNLSWVLENGNEYAQTFSEEELLDALKGKIVDYELRVRKSFVLGASFQDDLTELYKRDYPNDYPELLYDFECNLSDEYRNYDCCDEWGAATLWLNDKQGVEYNFCIDGDCNSCAIYKMYYDEESDTEGTDYSTFEHYEIDFDNANWREALEKAMHEVAKKFFE